MSSETNAISGRSAFLSLLKAEGVTRLFGNPGTTELPIMDALREHPDVGYVLGLQEALVVAMADGYARASGQLAACNVHVAPGLGNAMGSLYNAKFYGSPIILTAGQQEQGHGLTEPLLYDSLVPMATPLVKWAVEVTRLEDLPRIMRRAAKVAMTPPTGPVFISLPGDILNAEAAIDLGHPTRVDTAGRPNDEALERLAARLLAAKRPMIVAGHELATHDALSEAAALAEALGAPVYQQTVPYAAHYHSEHPCFITALPRDQGQTRAILEPYDLMICLGADVLRMSVWSEVDPLPEGMAIVQIGLRDWEMGKNYPTEIAVRADVKETLKALVPAVRAAQSPEQTATTETALKALSGRNWTHQRAVRTEALLAKADDTASPIEPELLIYRIVEALPDDVVVVDEGLITTRSLLNYLPLRDSQCYYGLASGGIGFAIAGAVGIQLALPDRPVVAIIGDGSAMYSIQALWTAANLKLPIVYIIANNRSYRIIKERLLAFHDNDNFIGMDFRSPELDFVGLATSMGLSAERVETAGDIGQALERAFNRDGPTLLDVSVLDGFS